MKEQPTFQRFKAVTSMLGINLQVVVPEKVLQILYQQMNKEKGPIPVEGTLQGKPFLANIVKYQGAHRLYINELMQKHAGITPGDIATITLRYDSRPRIEPMPELFARALKKEKGAQKIFDALAPSRKKEILRYLNNLKTQESLKRNTKIVVGYLAGKEIGTTLRPILQYRDKK